MAEPLTLYKLIILFMLDKVSFPLTNVQISNFILEQEYTTYFTLHQALSELQDSNLIRHEKMRNVSHYYITDGGTQTLDYFRNRIPLSIQEDIDLYLNEHRMELRNDVSILSDYYRTTSGEYAAHCVVKERDSNLIDLTLTVPLKKQAESICSQWKEKCQDIYSQLIKELL